MQSLHCFAPEPQIRPHSLHNLSYQSLEWQPSYQQFCAGLKLFWFLSELSSPSSFFTPPSFCSFLSMPSFSSSFPFLFLSITSLTLLALAFFMFSCSAQVNMVFVFHAMCTNENIFCLLYFVTSIPTLRLLMNNQPTQWNKSETQKSTHSLNQTKQSNSL